MLLYSCSLLVGFTLNRLLLLPSSVDGLIGFKIRQYNRCAPAVTGYLRLQSRYSGHTHLQTCSISASSFEEMKSAVVVPGNTTATLLRLIQFGDEWRANQSTLTGDGDIDAAVRPGMTMLDVVAAQNGFQRVTGCMANVQIRTQLIQSSSIPHALTQQQQPGFQSEMMVRIEGMADSRVAQGMLALLCMGLSGRPAAEVRLVSASQLTQLFEFDKLLPPGRLNGFANMIDLIVTQVAQRQQQQLQPSVMLESNVLELDIEEDSNNGVVGPMSSPNPTFPSTHAAPVFDSFSSETSSSSSSSSSSSGATSVKALEERGDEVAVLLSGGVDSSVALALLQEQGHKLRAYYLKIWLEDEVAHLNQCPWEEDLQYAQRVCDQLQVPLETLSLQAEYWQQVVQYTFDEARQGRTPNPDVMCNSRVKFGVFYDYIGRYHRRIATGHYAQIKSLASMGGTGAGYAALSSGTPADAATATAVEVEAEAVALVRSPDPVKDQSYFLSNLRQDQLQRCIFPIGHLQKHEVRQLAERFNLPTKHRKDSQGICFLGKLKFDDFIAHYLGSQPGPIRSYQTGEVIGEHKGLWFHTIGQRKGTAPLDLRSLFHPCL